MEEVVRSNDPVRLSWFTAVLRDAGIQVIEFDTHAAVLDGSVVAIQRRLMVADDDAEVARQLIAEADASLSQDTIGEAAIQDDEVSDPNAVPS